MQKTLHIYIKLNFLSFPSTISSHKMLMSLLPKIYSTFESIHGISMKLRQGYAVHYLSIHNKKNASEISFCALQNYRKHETIDRVCVC